MVKPTNLARREQARHQQGADAELRENDGENLDQSHEVTRNPV